MLPANQSMNHTRAPEAMVSFSGENRQIRSGEGECRGANTGRFGNFGVFPVFYMVLGAHKRRKSH